MPEKISHIGKTFGRLKVIGDAPPHIFPNGRMKHKSLCLCDCGKTIAVNNHRLCSGETRSCGCLRQETTSRRRWIHGHTANRLISKTFGVWATMIQRCTNPRVEKFVNYGGRGISVCPRWLKFENFLADMGEKPPGLSIDRINNDGNYEPGNCRWATAQQQALNKRPYGSC